MTNSERVDLIVYMGAWIVGNISADDAIEDKCKTTEQAVRLFFEEWMNEYAKELRNVPLAEFLLEVEKSMRGMDPDSEWVCPRAEWEKDPDTAMPPDLWLTADALDGRKA